MNQGADGFISLREAIIAANNSLNDAGGPDRIHFNIRRRRTAHDRRPVCAADRQRCGHHRRHERAGLRWRAGDRTERRAAGAAADGLRITRGRQHRARPGDQPLRRLGDLRQRRRRQHHPGQLHRRRRGGQRRPRQWRVRHPPGIELQSGRRDRSRRPQRDLGQRHRRDLRRRLERQRRSRATTSAPMPPERAP